MSLLIFFRRIDVIGLKNVPKSGPVIFVANHPSALIDPILVGSVLKRRLHFLAGAEWFGSGLKERIFKRQFNMIPVHRPWLEEGKEVSNKDMFEASYESLAKGKALIIFPEASSRTASKIRELKTGAVRIKEGYEKYIGNGEEAIIIPIGLSYSNPHSFQSRVVVNIGEAIQFHKDERVDDPKERYRSQTEAIGEALRQLIIHIDNQENEDLVSQVTRLYMDEQEQHSGVSFQNHQNHFEFNQNVAKAVDHFEKVDAEGYRNMSERIAAYFKQLRDAGISDDYIGQTKRSRISAGTWIYLVLGFLIALPSLLLFTIPYQLTKRLFIHRFQHSLQNGDEGGKLDPSFAGTLIFGVGSLIFIFWTLVVSLIFLITVNEWAALISLVVQYPMMRFSMHYAKILLRVRRFFTTKRIMKSRFSLVNELKEERNAIIARLKEYQVEYDQLEE